MSREHWSRMFRVARERVPSLLLALLVTACVGATAGSQSPGSPPKPVPHAVAPLDTLVQKYGYVRVPVDRFGGMFTMPMVIGKGTYELVFDSGMGEDLEVLKFITDSMGVHGTPARDRIGFGAPVPADTTHIGGVKIQQLALDSVFVKIGTSDQVAGSGAFGAALASRYSFILDYTQDALYLHPPIPRGAAPLPGVAMRPDDIPIPLIRIVSEKTHRVRYALHATVNGKSILLVLDTGADLSISFDEQQLAELGLTPTGASSVYGVGGHQAAQTGTVDHVLLGSMDVGPLPYTAPDMTAINQRGQEEGFPRFDGVLGATVFDTYGALIDFGHDALYLHDK